MNWIKHFFLRATPMAVLMLATLLLACRTGYAQAPGTDSLNFYNLQAMKLLNESKYEESMDCINKALRIGDNAPSRYYLAHIYAMEKNWPEAIKNGERAIQIDPTLDGAYPDLFYAYTQMRKWTEARALIDKAEDGGSARDMGVKHPHRLTENDIATVDAGVTEDNRSRVLITILFAALVGLFFRPVYKKAEEGGLDGTGNVRISELLLISAAVSCGLWMIFFACSQWIWAQNPHHPAADYAPIVRIFIYEHDGAESFVLYSLMFIDMLLTLVLTPLILRSRLNRNKYVAVFSVLILIAAVYFFSIGFYPPFPDIEVSNIFVPLLLGALAAGLYFLCQKKSLVAKVLAIAVMAFAGLISIGPPSLTDLQFIIDPALRLMHGFKVQDIYFQYDLLLSFLAIAWMKMNISIELFPYVGQVSFFLFYLGVFFFGDRFFKTRGLSALLIVAVMVMRFYAIFSDVPTILQVSPLRLDMWIILLLLANWKGIHHWLVGAGIGFLVLFHRNLGLLYLGGYAEMLVALYLADAVTLVREKGFNVKELVALVGKHIRANMVNLIVVAASIGLCFVLFHELFSRSAMLYRKLGIGMLPIAKISFYWYVPVLLCSLLGLVFYYRDRLGEKYTSVAVFVVMLTVSNSMYFFGRSHENNILNISAILVVALFVLFDILIFLNPGKAAAAKASAPKPLPRPAPAARNKKGASAPVPAAAPAAPAASTPALAGHSVYLVLPLIFILFIGYFYNKRISDKLKTQMTNLQESQFAYPFPEYPKDMGTVKVLTQNSQNVYFLDLYYDAFYYYNGDYAPLGFFSPASSWVFKKDYIDFMQGLLDKHYYILYVGQFANYYREYLPALKYNHVAKINDWVALSKDDVAPLLPETLHSQYHLAIKDSVGGPGIDYAGVNFGDNFTIEAIVKPADPQPGNAQIINAISQYNGLLQGFTLQAGGTPGRYVFGYSNRSATPPNVNFEMQSGTWHYLVIEGSREALKVYDNGKLVGTASAGGLPIANSDNPLTIGNRAGRDAKFNGLIREVNFSDGNLDEAQIAKNTEIVLGTLK